MFEYYLSSQYRKAYQFLSSIDFLQISGRGFNLDFNEIGIKFQSTKELEEVAFLIKCFKILSQNKKRPDGMIKTLIFAHLILQSLPKKSQELKTLLKNQLNKIIQSSKQYRQLKNPKVIIKNRKIVKAQTLDKFSTNMPIFTQCNVSRPQFDQNFSPVKDAKGIRRPSLKIQNININIIQPIQIPQDKINRRRTQSIHHKFSSPKQYICQKLIQPYACYLIKRIDSKLFNEQINQQTILQQNKQICVWSIINIYKLLLKIGQSFTHITRYYDKQYRSIIIHLLEILNIDLHQTYPLMIIKIKNMISDNIHMINFDIINQKVVIKQTQLENQIVETEECDNKKQINTNLTEMKQILLEISQINQKIICMYLNKWISEDLKGLNIKIPKLMPIQNQYCQFVFFKEEEQQKKIEKQKKKQNKLKKSKSTVLPLNFNTRSFRHIQVQDGIQIHETMTPIEIMKSRTPLTASKLFSNKNDCFGDLSTSISKRVTKKQSDLPLKTNFGIDQFQGQTQETNY